MICSLSVIFISSWTSVSPWRTPSAKTLMTVSASVSPPVIGVSVYGSKVLVKHPFKKFRLYWYHVADMLNVEAHVFRMICMQTMFACLVDIFLSTIPCHAFPVLLVYLFHPNFDGQSMDLQDVFRRLYC